MKFYLDKFIIAFDESMKILEFRNEWYYGISFFIEDLQYDLIHNFELKNNRIMISGYGYNRGISRDIPFYENTFHLLPEGIAAYSQNF